MSKIVSHHLILRNYESVPDDLNNYQGFDGYILEYRKIVGPTSSLVDSDWREPPGGFKFPQREIIAVEKSIGRIEGKGHFIGYDCGWITEFGNYSIILNCSEHYKSKYRLNERCLLDSIDDGEGLVNFWVNGAWIDKEAFPEDADVTWYAIIEFL